jgi:hypothetical protein
MFRENLTKFKRSESSLYTNPKPFMALTTGDIFAISSHDNSRVPRTIYRAHSFRESATKASPNTNNPLLHLTS